MWTSLKQLFPLPERKQREVSDAGLPSMAITDTALRSRQLGALPASVQLIDHFECSFMAVFALSMTLELDALDDDLARVWLFG